MKVHLRKTYLLHFSNFDDFIQFTIELKNKEFSKILITPLRFNRELYCICKIPINLEIIMVHIKEYCSMNTINNIEEAYLKEYGEIIKP